MQVILSSLLVVHQSEQEGEESAPGYLTESRNRGISLPSHILCETDDFLSSLSRIFVTSNDVDDLLIRDHISYSVREKDQEGPFFAFFFSRKDATADEFRFANF